MNQLMTKPETNNDIITKEKVTEYINTFLTNQLNKQESMQFVEIATAYNLNPFKREIYCIPYGQGDYRRLSIITGYEVYLKRAERLNLLDGYETTFSGIINKKTIKVERFAKGGGKYEKDIEVWRGDLSCTIIIYRKDRAKPFKKTVYFEEFTQDNEIWNSKPRFMLEKVTLAIGFRQCFPDEMGGMPYTSDEVPGNMIKEIVNVEEKESPPALPMKQSNIQKLKEELTKELAGRELPPQAISYIEASIKSRDLSEKKAIDLIERCKTYPEKKELTPEEFKEYDKAFEEEKPEEPKYNKAEQVAKIKNHFADKEDKADVDFYTEEEAEEETPEFAKGGMFKNA